MFESVGTETRAGGCAVLCWGYSSETLLSSGTDSWVWVTNRRTRVPSHLARRRSATGWNRRSGALGRGYLDNLDRRH